MIDLKPEYLDLIRGILMQYARDCEVRAFGSRVNGKSRPYSDLDLVLTGKDKIDWRQIEKIKQAFSESNLPFFVDILDWNTLSTEFRKVVQNQPSEILQRP